MIYWMLIVIGIILLSVSLSNPVYKILIKKYINIHLIIEIIFRILLFLLSLTIIFLSFYVESII